MSNGAAPLGGHPDNTFLGAGGGGEVLGGGRHSEAVPGLGVLCNLQGHNDLERALDGNGIGHVDSGGSAATLGGGRRKDRSHTKRIAQFQEDCHTSDGVGTRVPQSDLHVRA